MGVPSPAPPHSLAKSPTPPGHRTLQPAKPGLCVPIPARTQGPWVAQPRPTTTGGSQALTPKLLIRQALLVGEEEGEEPVQAGWGPPRDDVEEDGSVEDLEDWGWGGSWPLRARRLLPAGESQNPSMVGVGRDLWGHPAQPPAQAGSPTAGCTAPRPGGA